MRSNQEYNLAKAIAHYMKIQFPEVLYRFDMAGLNLSKTQAGMNKSIQFGKGYPDFQIITPRTVDGVHYNGMFLELKKEGEKLFKKNGDFVSEHVENQHNFILKLREAGYFASFSIGFDMSKDFIDKYLGQ